MTLKQNGNMITKQKINPSKTKILNALKEVKDPELPVISVIDLGLITGVRVVDSNTVKVSMAPTYTACPAIEIIKNSIKKKVESLGYGDVEVIVDKTVTWTTNRVSKKGKDALKNFGIAPPVKFKGELTQENMRLSSCPFCNSKNTTLNSPFGSALCRSIHYCYDCKQPFERFKPI